MNTWNLVLLKKEKEQQIPYCVLPLQIIQLSEKTALIFYMSPVNTVVTLRKVKLKYKGGRKC
jgi:hypothetical protein